MAHSPVPSPQTIEAKKKEEKKRTNQRKERAGNNQKSLHLQPFFFQQLWLPTRVLVQNGRQTANHPATVSPTSSFCYTAADRQALRVRDKPIPTERRAQNFFGGAAKKERPGTAAGKVGKILRFLLPTERQNRPSAHQARGAPSGRSGLAGVPGPQRPSAASPSLSADGREGLCIVLMVMREGTGCETEAAKRNRSEATTGKETMHRVLESSFRTLDGDSAQLGDALPGGWIATSSDGDGGLSGRHGGSARSVGASSAQQNEPPPGLVISMVGQPIARCAFLFCWFSLSSFLPLDDLTGRLLLCLLGVDSHPERIGERADGTPKRSSVASPALSVRSTLF